MIVIKTMLLFLLLELFLASSVFAITASIGNSRMVLRAAPNEIIERSILVRNVNSVPVTINFLSSGDLKDNIKLKEESFILQPGEEKKAYFTIKSDKEGSTETKINVRFTPEEGNGVGLSSTIIIIVSGTPSIEKTNSQNIDNKEELNEVNNKDNIKTEQISEKKFKIPDIKLLLIITFVLIIVLVVLFFYSLSIKQQKRQTMRNA